MRKENFWNNKILLSAIAFVIVLFIGVGSYFILNRKEDESKEENEPKITLAEAKAYLQKNWDSINMDGSTSMIPLHQALDDLFSKEKKEIKHSKTVDAFEKFIEGEKDILLGVTYSDDLLEKAKNSGVKLIDKKITREGFIFLLNKANPVDNLTIDQIKEIYSGNITNWKELGGQNTPIVAYQSNDNSGSQIRMNKFMGDKKLMDKIYVATKMGDLILY